MVTSHDSHKIRHHQVELVDTVIACRYGHTGACGKQEALLLQRDRATLLLVQILLTHDGGIYRA